MARQGCGEEPHQEHLRHIHLQTHHTPGDSPSPAGPPAKAHTVPRPIRPRLRRPRPSALGRERPRQVQRQGKHPVPLPHPRSLPAARCFPGGGGREGLDGLGTRAPGTALGQFNKRWFTERQARQRPQSDSLSARAAPREELRNSAVKSNTLFNNGGTTTSRVSPGFDAVHQTEW